MNMDRRNNFKSWFADVGIIYLIVAALVISVFVVASLDDTLRTTVSEAVSPVSDSGFPRDYLSASP